MWNVKWAVAAVVIWQNVMVANNSIGIVSIGSHQTVTKRTEMNTETIVDSDHGQERERLAIVVTVIGAMDIVIIAMIITNIATEVGNEEAAETKTIIEMARVAVSSTVVLAGIETGIAIGIESIDKVCVCMCAPECVSDWGTKEFWINKKDKKKNKL